MIVLVLYTSSRFLHTLLHRIMTMSSLTLHHISSCCFSRHTSYHVYFTTSCIPQSAYDSVATSRWFRPGIRILEARELYLFFHSVSNAPRGFVKDQISIPSQSSFTQTRPFFSMASDTFRGGIRVTLKVRLALARNCSTRVGSRRSIQTYRGG